MGLEIGLRREFLTTQHNRKSEGYIPHTPPKTKRADLWCNTKPTLRPQPSKERMKIMARHSSATPRERGDGESGGRGDGETRCSTLKSPSVESHNIESYYIDASLKRRARLLITNSSIPIQTRSLIRYARWKQRIRGLPCGCGGLREGN